VAVEAVLRRSSGGMSRLKLIGLRVGRAKSRGANPKRAATSPSPRPCRHAHVMLREGKPSVSRLSALRSGRLDWGGRARKRGDPAARRAVGTYGSFSAVFAYAVPGSHLDDRRHGSMMCATVGFSRSLVRPDHLLWPSGPALATCRRQLRSNTGTRPATPTTSRQHPPQPAAWQGASAEVVYSMVAARMKIRHQRRLSDAEHARRWLRREAPGFPRWDAQARPLQ